ncbi:MAG: sulfatase-like hydrolase/transferase, partial [Halobacteriales archaeon]
MTDPNVVVICCDDLGYGDLECYGSPYNTTPELNRLASEGIRFTSFHSSGPNCTPSRAAMMTGRYATRYGLGDAVVFPGFDHRGHESGLPPEEQTVASVL